MPEAVEINFSHRELVEMMIKKQGLHEGIWSLSVRFNFAASNIGASPTEVFPAMVASIAQIGLHRVDAETNIALDAAKVNPAPPQGKSTRTATK